MWPARGAADDGRGPAARAVGAGGRAPGRSRRRDAVPWQRNRFGVGQRAGSRAWRAPVLITRKLI
jgi:hypothetical protein